jgi:Fe-S-cluster containining protein
MHGIHHIWTHPHIMHSRLHGRVHHMKLHRRQLCSRSSHVDEAQLRDKHFACTGCGICCTGSGNVWCSKGELDAIIQQRDSGMSFEQGVGEYCNVDAMRDRNIDLHASEWFILKNAPGTDQCIFLNAENNHCMVYGARPLQCSTYPWWPELVESDKAWQHEAYTVCEGIVVMENSVDAVDRLDVIRETGAEFDTMEDKTRKLESFCTYLEDFPY